MTDFLSWWADHWPLVPAIAGYIAWEAYKWRKNAPVRMFVAAIAVKSILGAFGKLLPTQAPPIVVEEKRRREP